MSVDKTVQTELVPVSNAGDITSLLRDAVNRGVDVDTMERLVSLHERVGLEVAKRDYNDALAGFQNERPEIKKTSSASVSARSGAAFAYRYADLDSIETTIRPCLHKFGLSYSYDSKTVDDVLECTCTLRHVGGHEQSSSFACTTETKAGMSPQQKVSSALSFAKRQALSQILGLTMCDPDNDGAATGEVITEEQAADLDALVSEVGADRAKFLKYLQVTDFEEVLAARFDSAVSALERKRQG